ncbi:MAG: hypothetical protein M3Z05_12420 [Gemmatimonadota bacterium]|nr:hypothetical protein [Gemmatimonadota bacterium]
MVRSSSQSYVKVIPALDEWESLRILLPLLQRALLSASLTASVLIVDDGSDGPPPLDIVHATPGALIEYRVPHFDHAPWCWEGITRFAAPIALAL